MNDQEYIDLYAEDILEDEILLQNDTVSDNLDLYDDVLFNSPTKVDEKNLKIHEESNNQTTIKNPSTNFETNHSSSVGESKSETTRKALIDDNKKSDDIKLIKPDNIQEECRDHNIAKTTYQLYIGKLAWWTSREEIINAIKKIEVTDLQEVKLFINKKNGCSKGYCLISVGSQESMKLCMEVLPNHKIHDRRPVVMVATKHAANTLEGQYYIDSNIDNYCKTIRSSSYTSQIPLPNMKVPPPGYGSQMTQTTSFQYQSTLNCNKPAPQNFSREHCRISDQELEDTMKKIKSLSKLAISRARTEAKKKEYKSVEDTLKKAISLIEDSKAAHDVRCKLLINSLEDELKSIMGNNRSKSRSRSSRMSRCKENYRYRRRSSERSLERNCRDNRERSRERNPKQSCERGREQSYKRSGKQSRERSREKIRERFRKRSRERYHERSRERYRKRSRERYRKRSRERYRKRSREQSRDRPNRSTKKSHYQDYESRDSRRRR